ncbi:hypothetical protein L1047_01840 [Synechococcus sp. Nb3U1]|uniref:hypothetical protein n=1 Tax=Synechococcus sp. Nb3U1 TaxID=1914529 RepID=UPI001F31FF8F|nr:hypothetical protein [Synechococcus sp. Nb3U1]MCF2969937.1 hypothetical protein [Synechococcus sp. Nb3U1]
MKLQPLQLCPRKALAISLIKVSVAALAPLSLLACQEDAREQPTVTITPIPAVAPTPTPILTPNPLPTPMPSLAPTPSPTFSPSPSPSPSPTTTGSAEAPSIALVALTDARQTVPFNVLVAVTTPAGLGTGISFRVEVRQPPLTLTFDFTAATVGCEANSKTCIGTIPITIPTSVPTGVYEVTAMVADTQGKIASAKAPLMVLPAPSASPSPTPTSTGTPNPFPSVSPSPSPSPSPTVSPSPTASPTATPTP